MLRRYRVLTVFFIFAIVFNLIPANIASAINEKIEPVVPIPDIISIQSQGGRYINRPLVEGYTKTGTEVTIYINGTYAGDAKVDNQDSRQDLSRFVFQPGNDLPVGTHRVFAIAKDPTSLRLSPPTPEFEIFIVPLPAPTLVLPGGKTVSSNVRQPIAGLSVSGTRVHIYIDGIYNGSTDFINHPSGTADFAYEPFLNLEPGEHAVWAMAEDQLGRMSAKSNILRFKIEHPYPAPTLFLPVGINSSGEAIVSGVAKNDSRVKIFVDHELKSEFKVDNHESGTASFARSIGKFSGNQTRLIYATAVDSRGKESRWSNFAYYPPSPVREPSISDEAAEESMADGEEPAAAENGLISDLRLRDLLILAALFENGQGMKFSGQDFIELKELIENPNKPDISEADFKRLENLYNAKKDEFTVSEEIDQAPDAPAKEDSEENGEPVQPDEDLSDIEDIINQGQSTSTVGTGAINEAQENQGKLQLNLLIFIAFLLAVIGWIFWVNRELIKERRQQNEDKE